MKEGYGNVCDEPGETWPGLASTFTQKRINLFNHPELPLCIPDEESKPVCACWVLPVIWKSLNMLEKVVGNRVRTFWQWVGGLNWPELATKTRSSCFLRYFPLLWYWSHLEHNLPVLPFISPTKQQFACFLFQIKGFKMKYAWETSERGFDLYPSGSEDAI